MPIRLTTPKTDPVTGIQCDHAKADKIHITTIGDCCVRFTVFFGHLVDDVFQPVVDGGTFAVRNVPARTESGLDADGNPTVTEVPADLQFDGLCGMATSLAAGESAWCMIGDRAIYPWLIAYTCPVSGGNPFAGEVV